MYVQHAFLEHDYESKNNLTGLERYNHKLTDERIYFRFLPHRLSLGFNQVCCTLRVEFQKNST